eukprot:5055162-Pyramimonas_sp.AAC.1
MSLRLLLLVVVATFDIVMHAVVAASQDFHIYVSCGRCRCVRGCSYSERHGSDSAHCVCFGVSFRSGSRYEHRDMFLGMVAGCKLIVLRLGRVRGQLAQHRPVLVAGLRPSGSGASAEDAEA